MNKLFIYNRQTDNCIFYHEWRALSATNNIPDPDSFGKRAAKSVRSIFSFSNEFDRMSLKEKGQDTPKSKSVSLVGDILPTLTKSFARSKLSLSEYFTHSSSPSSIEIGEQQDTSPPSELEEDPEELENKKQLVHGVAFTIDGIIQKLSQGGQESFVGYKAGNYAMHHFVSPTGYRFVLIAERNSIHFMCGRKLIIAIYENCFVKFFCLNSLQLQNDSIRPENAKFKNSLMALLNKKK